MFINHSERSCLPSFHLQCFSSPSLYTNFPSPCCLLFCHSPSYLVPFDLFSINQYLHTIHISHTPSFYRSRSLQHMSHHQQFFHSLYHGIYYSENLLCINFSLQKLYSLFHASFHYKNLRYTLLQMGIYIYLAHVSIQLQNFLHIQLHLRTFTLRIHFSYH